MKKFADSFIRPRQLSLQKTLCIVRVVVSKVLDGNLFPTNLLESRNGMIKSKEKPEAFSDGSTDVFK